MRPGLTFADAAEHYSALLNPELYHRGGHNLLQDRPDALAATRAS